MAAAARKPKNFDEYAGRFPEDVRQLLGQMRETIRKAAPKAQETISYGIPAFRQEAILVWFAAHAKHIGLYPGASGIAAFKTELTPYTYAKGSVQFPMTEPLPLALIMRIVQFRVKERSEKQGVAPRRTRELGQSRRKK